MAIGEGNFIFNVGFNLESGISIDFVKNFIYNLGTTRN
jgi:hypothetical protein